MTAETYHFDKGTEMPFKFQDRWVAGATGFKDIQDAFRHLEWREARRRLAEIAEKYDLDEYGCHVVEPGNSDRPPFSIRK